MLDAQFYPRLDAILADADRALEHDYPGDDGSRQPVHTAYVPVEKYTADVSRQWGDAALDALHQHVPDAAALAALLDLEPTVAAEVLPRVEAKLRTEPIEDLRIDFEDGYGIRPDDVEDAAALAAGRTLAASGDAAPAFVGIRFKCLEPATRRRGVRTIDVFLTALLADRPLPPGFLVTLPKVSHLDHVRAFVEVCAALEDAHNLPAGALRFEMQIETPQAVLGANGAATVARMVHAGAGRIVALNYGTYDYSAGIGIAAPYQTLDHPVADHAKAVMQAAAAGTGVRLSDGSSNVLPVGSATEIISAWRLHGRLVRRSLERGYYQGWDLHPLQLVSRYAATYAFYRDGLPSAADRLRAYLGQLDGRNRPVDPGTLDEPATAQAMVALLMRGLQCGALDSDEVRERTGVEPSILAGLYRRRSR